MNESADVPGRTRWRQLTDLYLVGTISAQEAGELENALAAHPLARADFRRACSVDAALRQAARTQMDVPSADSRRKETRIPWRSPAWLALAACLAAFAGLAVFFEMRPEGFSVQVVAADDARLDGRGEVLRVGEELTGREIVLRSGFARLRLGRGVLLDLNAPLRATIESGMRLRLVEGRMSADVGKHGKGFTVVTDAGEVVDLGTQFGVEADPQGESRVAVFSGQVKVRPGGGGFTTINEGEAVRFTALAGLRRWTQVALAVDAAGLERVPADGVLAAVRDNLGDEELHPFYGVVRQGMQPGALAFTDKPNPRWAPEEGDSLPEWLLGADLVRTYHQFRLQRNYELTLTLREAAAVFVLIDSRQTPPAWLTERFTDTGASVRVGPWMQGMAGFEGVETDADGQPFLAFSVWRTDAPAGDFILGPAHVRKNRNLPFALMYGVAVRAVPQSSSSR